MCIGLARGYPLRFLTADQGTPMISSAAQWSLVSFSAFYLIWLQGCPRSCPEGP
jgi:hypothetical protein